MASDAFQRHQFKESERLCKEVLARNPGKQIRAQTTAWMAVIQDCMGAPKHHCEALFAAAFEIDPDNVEVTANYHAFKDLEYDIPEQQNRIARWTLAPSTKSFEVRQPNWKEQQRAHELQRINQSKLQRGEFLAGVR